METTMGFVRVIDNSISDSIKFILYVMGNFGVKNPSYFLLCIGGKFRAKRVVILYKRVKTAQGAYSVKRNERSSVG